MAFFKKFEFQKPVPRLRKYRSSAKDELNQRMFSILNLTQRGEGWDVTLAGM